LPTIKSIEGGNGQHYNEEQVLCITCMEAEIIAVEWQKYEFELLAIYAG